MVLLAISLLAQIAIYAAPLPHTPISYYYLAAKLDTHILNTSPYPNSNDCFSLAGNKHTPNLSKRKTLCKIYGHDWLSPKRFFVRKSKYTRFRTERIISLAMCSHRENLNQIHLSWNVFSFTVLHATSAMWSRKLSVSSGVSGASKCDDADVPLASGLQLYPFAIALRVRVLQVRTIATYLTIYLTPLSIWLSLFQFIAYALNKIEQPIKEDEYYKVRYDVTKYYKITLQWLCLRKWH